MGGKCAGAGEIPAQYILKNNIIRHFLGPRISADGSGWSVGPEVYRDGNL